MSNIIPLSDLKIGKTGIIKEVNCENIKRRLFDLGFIPNTSITPIFKSIFSIFVFYNKILIIKNRCMY